jgi:hypothetical protein
MVVFGGIAVLALIPTIFVANWMIAGLFAVATFSYAAFSTIANVRLPTFFKRVRSPVSGLSGMAAGIGTIIAFTFIRICIRRAAGDGHSFF